MVSQALSAAEPTALIAIGGSAGAIEVLSVLLPVLPADAPPVAVVLHLPAKSPSKLAQIFAYQCRMKCVEVDDKDALLRGQVHFCPPGYHLLVEPGDSFALSVDEPVHFARPSIDVFFESAARVLGKGVLAIALTGANDDGARGLRAVYLAGGTTVVQSPESSRAESLPRAALSLTEPSFVGSPQAIASYLKDRFDQGIMP